MGISASLIPYAPPVGPPGEKGEQVPAWMVSKVIEERHSRRLRAAGKRREERKSVFDEPEIGAQTLGGP